MDPAEDEGDVRPRRPVDDRDVLDCLTSGGFGPGDMAGNGTYASWAEYLVGDVQSEAPFRSVWRDRLKRSEAAMHAFERGMGALETLVGRRPDRGLT